MTLIKYKINFMPEEKKDLLHKLFGSSPKTTIMGYISAIGVAVYPFLTDEGFDIKTDWKNLLIAIGIAVWGRLQKDSNGITASEAKAVIKPSVSNTFNTSPKYEGPPPEKNQNITQ